MHPERIAVATAVIPAAGRGARLDRPLTPKPLVDVGGQPLLVRLLNQLAAVGVTRAIVIVGHEGKRVARGLSHHPRVELELELVEAPNWEEGLATSVLAAAGRVSGPFFLAMADHYFDDELVRRMSRPAPREGSVSALVETDLGRVADVSSAVKVRLEGRSVSAFGRKLDGADAIDAGLFVAWPNLFDALSAARAVSPRAELADGLQLLGQQGLVEAVTTDGRLWADIDTPASVVQAEMRIRHARRFSAGARPSAPTPVGNKYRFVTGHPVTTEITVGRGTATELERFAVQIPAESGTSPLFVFTDETVNRLYGDRFMSCLERLGYQAHRIVTPDGEGAKSMESFNRLVEEVLALGIDERSVLISLGGGVVCNVCGFIASTLYRGIGLIHVPTTLMAQCDAAISHKQGINGVRGKNLVGSYYAPTQIVVDVDLLASLEPRRIADGMSEIIKHGLGQDEKLLEKLLSHSGDHRDPLFLQAVVERNIQLKCALTSDDPKEHGPGMVLMYGHTAGHAVEWLSGYELSHGESVAIGMMVAARVSRILGGCSDELVSAHERVLTKYGLPRHVPAEISTPDILEAMRYGKRYLTEGFRMCLLADVGKLWSVDGDTAIPVSEPVLVQAIDACRAPGGGA
jgi:3-dehydroquinate synthase